MDLYMKICPVKMLYRILAEQDVSHSAAVICTDEALNHTKLRGIPYIQAKFADIITPTNNSFDRKLARKIAFFIDSLPDDISMIYICCSAGESRSPAIAAATMKYFGQNDILIWKNPKYHPNILVYRIMCQEFGLKISRLRIWCLMKINKHAFSKAIHATRKGNRR